MTTAHKPARWKVQGQTYPLRGLLGDQGWEWIGSEKAWFRGGSAEDIRADALLGSLGGQATLMKFDYAKNRWVEYKPDIQATFRQWEDVLRNDPKLNAKNEDY